MKKQILTSIILVTFSANIFAITPQQIASKIAANRLVTTVTHAPSKFVHAATKTTFRKCLTAYSALSLACNYHYTITAVDSKIVKSENITKITYQQKNPLNPFYLVARIALAPPIVMYLEFFKYKNSSQDKSRT